jgi:hypothetical protein
VAPKCRRCGFPFRVQACVRDQCQGARPRTSCETYPASNCPVSLASGDSPRTQQAALIRQRVIQGLQPFCNRIRAALQPLCNRATTEQPRTRVKPSLRRPASSGRFAAVRGRSRSVNQSGRTVQNPDDNGDSGRLQRVCNRQSAPRRALVAPIPDVCLSEQAYALLPGRPTRVVRCRFAALGGRTPTARMGASVAGHTAPHPPSRATGGSSVLSRCRSPER